MGSLPSFTVFVVVIHAANVENIVAPEVEQTTRRKLVLGHEAGLIELFEPKSSLLSKV
jgi:hypothetical protein